MSDFYGCLSSSSFRVRDSEQFIADPDVQMIKKHAESSGGFFVENDKFFAFGWEDQYPSTILEREEIGSDGEPEEVDIAGVIERAAEFAAKVDRLLAMEG